MLGPVVNGDAITNGSRRSWFAPQKAHGAPHPVRLEQVMTSVGVLHTVPPGVFESADVVTTPMRCTFPLRQVKNRK